MLLSLSISTVRLVGLPLRYRTSLNALTRQKQNLKKKKKKKSTRRRYLEAGYSFSCYSGSFQVSSMIVSYSDHYWCIHCIIWWLIWLLNVLIAGNYSSYLLLKLSKKITGGWLFLFLLFRFISSVKSDCIVLWSLLMYLLHYLMANLTSERTYVSYLLLKPSKKITGDVLFFFLLYWFISSVEYDCIVLWS